jgi:hypothetical protein
LDATSKNLVSQWSCTELRSDLGFRRIMCPLSVVASKQTAKSIDAKSINCLNNSPPSPYKSHKENISIRANAIIHTHDIQTLLEKLTRLEKPSLQTPSSTRALANFRFFQVPPPWSSHKKNA